MDNRGQFLKSYNFIVFYNQDLKTPEKECLRSELSDSCIGLYRANSVGVKKVLE